jgi:hypothetical protein
VRYRLRFGDHDVDLVEGEFILGRELDCVIRLEDPAASRRHARLDVAIEDVMLTDLGSRNGTFVNGEPLGSAPRKLVPGDVVRIGGEEFRLVLVDVRQDTGLHSTMALRRCPHCHKGVQPGTQQCPFCRGGLEPVGITLDDVSTATLSLGDLADKAVSMGRLNEAKKCLELQLRDYMRRALPVQPDRQVEGTVRTLLRVAVESRDTSWIDRLFSLFAARRWRLSLALMQQVRVVLQEVRNQGVGLDEYLAVWEPKLDTLSDEEQAELARLADLRGRPRTPADAGV